MDNSLLPLLLEPQQLAEQLDRSELLILDTSSAETYAVHQKMNCRKMRLDNGYQGNR